MSELILRMRYRVGEIRPRFALGLSICVAGTVITLQSLASGLVPAWMSQGGEDAQALQAALLAGGATGLGALFVLTVRQRSSSPWIFSFLALSAGVMSCAALLSLIGPAVLMSANPLAVDALLAAAFGYVAMALLDRLLPHLHAAPCESGVHQSHAMQLMVVAIAVHNLPEGFAVGAGFGGGEARGWATAVSIGLQNIPEGLIVATALWSIGMRRTSAIVLAAATGLLEPLGAIFGLAAASISASMLPWALAASGGAMLFVVLEELIPESLRGRSHRTTATWFAVGALGMAGLLTAV